MTVMLMCACTYWLGHENKHREGIYDKVMRESTIRMKLAVHELLDL